MCQLPEIIECHAVSGGLDYMLKAVVEDIPAYQSMIERLLESELGIERYFTYVVTKPVISHAQYLLEMKCP